MTARGIFGTISIVLSVVSLLVFWWLSIIAVVLGIVGLLAKDKADDKDLSEAMCIIGVVIGSVALLIVGIRWIGIGCL